MTTGHEELGALQRELAQVRQELASRAAVGVETGSATARSMVGRIVATAALGAVAGLLVLIGLMAVVTGDLAVAVVLLLPGGLLATAAVRIGRPAVRTARRGSLEREVLLDRERALLARSAQLQAAVRPTATPFGVGPAPRAPARQPSSYAQMMHARFPVGRSPERALAELPSDAPAWQVAFHRALGWGTVPPLLLALGLVAGVTLSALR